MTGLIDIDEIFHEDRDHPPAERSLPWEETRDGVTVVVEPKPHWAEDMRAFRLDAASIAATPTGQRMAPGRGFSAMSTRRAMR